MAARVSLLAVATVAIVALAALSYGLVAQMANGSQTPKVTWSSKSLTLNFTAPGSVSQVVTFTCSPSAGPVTLRLSSSLESIVTLSQTNFASCNSTPNRVTITASSTVSLNVGGTLHVTQPDNYRTLATPLQITVQGKPTGASPSPDPIRFSIPVRHRFLL